MCLALSKLDSLAFTINSIHNNHTIYIVEKYLIVIAACRLKLYVVFETWTLQKLFSPLIKCKLKSNKKKFNYGNF